MAKIYSSSSPSVSSHADIFNIPITDATLESSIIAIHRPLLPLSPSNPKIEFKIYGSPTQYNDLGESFLIIKIKVLPIGGLGKLGSSINGKIALCNNTLHSIFSEVELFLNGQKVESSNFCYGYKAYFQTLLKQRTLDKVQLRSAGFYNDGDLSLTDSGNLGFKARAALVDNSEEIELCGKLFLDLSFQNRFILNNTEIGIVLTKASQEFALLAPNYNDSTSPAKGQFLIQDAAFCIRQNSLFASIPIAHH